MIGRLAFLTLFFAAPAAIADPCKAIPDRGPLPAYLSPGAKFSGRVVHVGDGDSLCVSKGPHQTDWVEVRLEDFYAPELSRPGGQEAKSALEGLVRSRTVKCRASHRSYDRIVAKCWRDGVSLGKLMRDAGVSEGGRGR